jgi:hypothetical protein
MEVWCGLSDFLVMTRKGRWKKRLIFLMVVRWEI